MPYLNLDIEFLEHPKTKRLRAQIGDEGIVCLVRLWLFAAKFHPEDGDLSEYSDQEIEEFAGWTGESGCFKHATSIAKYLDKHCLGIGYVLHDWSEHQGHLAAFKQRAKDAARKRWDKYRSDTTLEQKQVELSSCATSNATSNANSNAPICSFPNCSALSLSKEKKNILDSELDSQNPDHQVEVCNRVLEYYNQRAADIGKSTLRMDMIAYKLREQFNECLRQKAFTIDNLKKAIDGCFGKRFNRDGGHLRFGTIFKNADSVNGYILASENPEVDDQGNEISQTARVNAEILDNMGIK